MGRDPKRSPTKEIKHQLQPRWAMKRSHCSPVDRENLSLLLTSIIWWSSQKRRTTHKTIKRAKGKLEPKIISSIKSDSYSQFIIHTTHKHVTIPQAIHYNSTRLIRIHITWSDSADACTCGGYLCSPPSYVLQVLQWIKFRSPQG